MHMAVDTFFLTLPGAILMIVTVEEEIRRPRRNEGISGGSMWRDLAGLGWRQRQPDGTVRAWWVLGGGGAGGRGNEPGLSHRWPTPRTWAWSESLEDADCRWPRGELLRGLKAVPALGGGASSKDGRRAGKAGPQLRCAECPESCRRAETGIHR